MPPQLATLTEVTVMMLVRLDVNSAGPDLELL
jgi:hypothetical protein